MNTLIFGLLAIFSLFIFVKLGKIKASTKQLSRSDRIKWRRNRDKDLNEETKNSKNAVGKPTQSNDQEAPTLGLSNFTNRTTGATLPDASDSSKLDGREKGDNQNAKYDDKGNT